MWEYLRHPKPGRQCEIRTKDGVYEAVWVDRINKYVSCNRWRRTEAGLSKKDRWVNDDEVIEWQEI